MSLITLTDQAVSHFQGILGAMPGAVGIRLGVRKSGCSGSAYTLDPADEIQADDHVIEVGGLRLLVNSTSLPKLEGMELDWVANAWGGDLQFNNPNVKSQCGCGQSFNTEK